MVWPELMTRECSFDVVAKGGGRGSAIIRTISATSAVGHVRPCLRWLRCGGLSFDSGNGLDLSQLRRAPEAERPRRRVDNSGRLLFSPEATA